MERKYNCAVELALDLLGAKWKPVLLAQLKQGPFRYSEPAARVPNMSDKMLSQRLHELTELGFIRRIGLRYALTEEGERLIGFSSGTRVVLALGVQCDVRKLSQAVAAIRRRRAATPPSA